MPGVRQSMNEAEFQRFILDYSRAVGWMRMHTRSVPVKQGNSFRHITPLSGEEGYFDLTLIRRGRVAFVEVKSERGYASQQQVDWLNQASDEKLPPEAWRSRDEIPSGRAFHPVGGWTDVVLAGDWQILVALVRPRHKDWIVEILR